MKKILRGVFVAALLLAAAWWVVQYWITSGESATDIVCLYTAASADAVNFPAVADQLNEAGMEASLREIDGSLEAAAKESLQAGADVLIVSLDQAPADHALLEAAQSYQADLFFVGAYPGDAYLNAYDKAYYVGSRAEYAGELAGQAAALAYRGGAIPDLTGNLLLDYLSAGAESGNSATALQSALGECEHYGVYSQPSLTQHAAEAEAQAADSTAESAASSTVEEPPASETLTEVLRAAGLDSGAVALGESWCDMAYEPEIIYCMSLDALHSAEAYAAYAGWSDRESPVAFVAFVTGIEQAQQADDGLCGTIIYYDTDTVGSAVVQMVLNLAQQNYIAESTGLSPDRNAALWVPFRVYLSAADHLPEPEAEPEADSTAADSAPAA